MSDQLKISKEIIAFQQRLFPEVNQLIEMRYNIMAAINNKQPIGRRNLANFLKMGERHVRNEIDFFQTQKLVSIERQGVMMTKAGEEALIHLKHLLYAYNGIELLEKELVNALHLQKAIICPGDIETNHEVLRFMGRSGAKYTLSVMKNKDTLAMTGGQSTAVLVDEMRESYYPEVTVIPARGGIGKSHATQANSVVAEMGMKLHSNYELLHLPDNIDQSLLDALKNYPEIKRVFDKMEHIDIFIFGLGCANVMADRRNMDLTEKQKILDQGAVAEAFGHYFGQNGEVISHASRIGMDVEAFKKIPHAIALAGGAAKAEAIIAISQIREGIVLITDEAAAVEILRKREAHTKEQIVASLR